MNPGLGVSESHQYYFLRLSAHQQHIQAFLTIASGKISGLKRRLQTVPSIKQNFWLSKTLKECLIIDHRL